MNIANQPAIALQSVTGATTYQAIANIAAIHFAQPLAPLSHLTTGLTFLDFNKSANQHPPQLSAAIKRPAARCSRQT
jgi:hypothetical protein